MCRSSVPEIDGCSEVKQDLGRLVKPVNKIVANIFQVLSGSPLRTSSFATFVSYKELEDFVRRPGFQPGSLASKTRDVSHPSPRLTHMATRRSAFKNTALQNRCNHLRLQQLKKDRLKASNNIGKILQNKTQRQRWRGCNVKD